ncbi:MAG: hypothetical protein GY754_07785 [bacterium]|nr:hypothetical protein [bacterium]
MKKVFLENGCFLETYYGEELSLLNNDTLIALADCYAEVFNQSWNEKWTRETALNEIMEAFINQEDRIPLVTIIQKEGKIIGFAWGILTGISCLEAEKDMPYGLSKEKKEEGLTVAKYWLKNVLEFEKIFLYREFGIIQQYRGKLASFLTVNLLELAYEKNIKTLLYWTDLKSRIFYLGLGAGGYPIHFFLENDLILMGGNIKYSLDTARLVSDSNASDESYKIVAENINKYLCKI